MITGHRITPAWLKCSGLTHVQLTDACREALQSVRAHSNRCLMQKAG